LQQKAESLAVGLCASSDTPRVCCFANRQDVAQFAASTVNLLRLISPICEHPDCAGFGSQANSPTLPLMRTSTQSQPFLTRFFELFLLTNLGEETAKWIRTGD
jgi:hypothetical protein